MADATVRKSKYSNATPIMPALVCRLVDGSFMFNMEGCSTIIQLTIRSDIASFQLTLQLVSPLKFGLGRDYHCRMPPFRLQQFPS
jgi:hypothetical protein